MPAEHDEPALAQAVSQHHLQLFRLFERHRVQVRVQLRHEPLTEPPHDARGLDTLLVVLNRRPGESPVMPT